MNLRASWAGIGLGVSLALAPSGCKRGEVVEPIVAEYAGAEPTGLGPLVIVEAPTQRRITCEAATPSGSLSLIPETAQWLVRIGPSSLMSSVFWSLLGPQIETNNELSSALAAVRGCGIEPAALEDIWVGFETDNENFVVIVHGPGIGEPALATCALRAMHRETANARERADDQEPEPEPEQPLTLSDYGGMQMMQFEGGAGYLINPDELVLTTRDWQQPVAQLAQCIGRPAITLERGRPDDGSSDATLQQLITRVDSSADVWVIGRPTGAVASMFMMLGLPATDQLGVVFMSDFRSGYGFDLHLTLESAATAEQARASLMTMLDQVASSGDPLLQQLMAGVSVGASGSLLFVRGSVSADQLAMIRDKL